MIGLHATWQALVVEGIRSQPPCESAKGSAIVRLFTIDIPPFPPKVLFRRMVTTELKVVSLQKSTDTNPFGGDL